MELADVLLYLIARGPGHTARELAEAIYNKAEQSLVNQDCQILYRKGSVCRKGVGGQADPYTYHPISG